MEQEMTPQEAAKVFNLRTILHCAIKLVTGPYI